MKKFFGKIHLWLSIPLGLVITIICLTGATLVFESEISRLLQPKVYRVESPEGAAPLAPAALAVRITEAMPDTLHLSSLRLSADAGEPVVASFRETGRKQLSIDPYTGAAKGWVERPAFFGTIRQLHRWLLDAPKSRGEKSVGKVIVGVTTLCMVVILITGLVIWFPKNRKGLRQRLTVAFTKGRRRLWHDSHVSLGFYATLFLLVMALTGLTWSFGWYRTAAYSLFGAGEQPVAVRQERKPQASDGKRKEGKRSSEKPERAASTPNYVVWDKVYAELRELYPSYETMTLSPSSAEVSRHSWVRRTDRVSFDPQTGRLGEIKRYEDGTRQQKLRSWFYAFHTGTWGGVWTKTLYFLAALIGASLPLTGYYLWWKRSFRRKRK